MIAKILFSQPIRCKSRSLLFISRSKIFPRLSLQLTCAGSRGFCFGGKRTEPVMHTLTKTKETTLQMQRTRVIADYTEGSQPSGKIYQPTYEWNNCFKILFLSITADSTPTLWTAHVTFCGWPGCSRKPPTQRLQLRVVSPRICEENHW